MLYKISGFKEDGKTKKRKIERKKERKRNKYERTNMKLCWIIKVVHVALVVVN